MTKSENIWARIKAGFFVVNSVAQTSSAGKAIRGNIQKNNSYREAWARIKLAKEHGFNLEVIVILESIITDRLISHANGKFGLNLAHSSNLGSVIKQAGKAFAQTGDDKSTLLLEKIDAWRKRRNEAAHAIVKSNPGTAPIEIGTFLNEAGKTADEGIELAIEVTKWHRRHLRTFKKSLSCKPC